MQGFLFSPPVPAERLERPAAAGAQRDSRWESFGAGGSRLLPS